MHNTDFIAVALPNFEYFLWLFPLYINTLFWQIIQIFLENQFFTTFLYDFDLFFKNLGMKVL